MAAVSSKGIPYFVLIIVVAALGYEAYSGTALDLEQFIPLLTAMGIGGAVLSGVKSAAKIKQIIPQDIKDRIATEVRKVIAPPAK